MMIMAPTTTTGFRIKALTPCIVGDKRTGSVCSVNSGEVFDQL